LVAYPCLVYPCSTATAPAPSTKPLLGLFALLIRLAPHPHRTLNCPQPARPTCILIPTEMLYLLGTRTLSLLSTLHPAPSPCLVALHPCFAYPFSTHTTLTEIETQSQKPAPHQTKHLLVIYTPAPPYPCLAPLLCTLQDTTQDTKPLHPCFAPNQTPNQTTLSLA